MDAEPLRGNVNRFPLPAPSPVPETYFEKNRFIEDMFCHEKLEVYQKSVEFLKEDISVIRLLPNGNSDIVNQLRRAATSISLNIAKSATKTPTSLVSSLAAMLSKLVFKG